MLATELEVELIACQPLTQRVYHPGWQILQDQEITCFEVYRCLCTSCKQSRVGGSNNKGQLCRSQPKMIAWQGCANTTGKQIKNEPLPSSEDSVFLTGDNKCKAVQSLAWGNVKSISHHLHTIISSALLIRLEKAVGTCVPWRGPGGACCTFQGFAP